MRNFILGIAALIALVACTTTEPASIDLGLGTYEADTLLTVSERFVMQTELSANNTFRARSWYYFSKDSSCMIREITAKYSYKSGSLTLTDRKQRERSACEVGFGVYEDSPSSSHQIRNVTPSSFELFVVSTDEAPAAWIRFYKI